MNKSAFRFRQNDHVIVTYYENDRRLIAELDAKIVRPVRCKETGAAKYVVKGKFLTTVLDEQCHPIDSPVFIGNGYALLR